MDCTRPRFSHTQLTSEYREEKLRTRGVHRKPVRCFTTVTTYRFLLVAQLYNHRRSSATHHQPASPLPSTIKCSRGFFPSRPPPKASLDPSAVVRPPFQTALTGRSLDPFAARVPCDYCAAFHRRRQSHRWKRVVRRRGENRSHLHV